MLQSPAGEAPEASASKKSSSKKVELGEEDVDIGDEMPSTNFPPVEIEKDATGGYASGSSSSSSSSSDSSSSSGKPFYNRISSRFDKLQAIGFK